MSDIPADLIHELLLRLPNEDLARFRCVCKTWKRIIDDRYFVESHLLSQRGGDNDNLIISDYPNLYSMSLTSLYHDNNSEGQTRTVEHETLRNLTSVGLCLHDFPVASCDGLIVVSGVKSVGKFSPVHYSHGLVRYCPPGSQAQLGGFVFGFLPKGLIPIGNMDLTYIPISLPPLNQCGICFTQQSVLTRERRKLPLVNREQNYGCWRSVGFGYDRVSDDYKVVRISTHRKYDMETVVYSLNADEWQRIEPYSNYPAYPNKDPGIFINGAINWLTRGSRQEEEFILALDLSTEKYREIPLPSTSFYFVDYLSVVNGCLVFIGGYYAWMLNDYGGKEIWTKFISLEHVGIEFRWFSGVTTYLKSKEEVLIQSDDEGFLWYNLQTGGVKKVTIKGFTLEKYTSCQVFPTSLIQLNGNRRKQTLIRSKKRVNLELTTSDVWVPPEGCVLPEN